jgi:hypothetical protein
MNVFALAQTGRNLARRWQATQKPDFCQKSGFLDTAPARPAAISVISQEEALAPLSTAG